MSADFFINIAGSLRAIADRIENFYDTKPASEEPVSETPSEPETSETPASEETSAEATEETPVDPAEAPSEGEAPAPGEDAPRDSAGNLTR